MRVLVIMRCEAHGRCFTVYPPGMVPWQRYAIEPDTDGLIDAVTDATDRLRWPTAADEPCARTQSARVRRVAALLGLLASRSLTEQGSQILGSPLSEHLDARNDFARARLVCDRGRILERLLGNIEDLRLGSLWAVGYRARVVGLCFETDSDGHIWPVCSRS